MAEKKYLKETTVARIAKLANKFHSKKQIMESTEYKNMYTHYLNAVEKDNIDLIIDGVLDDRTFDEIKLILKGETITMNTKKNVKKNDITNSKIDEERDPIEEETEKIFMISQQKVVEVSNVDVIIGGEEPDSKVKDDDHTIIKVKPSANDKKVINANFKPADNPVNDEVIITKETKSRTMATNEPAKEKAKESDERPDKLGIQIGTQDIINNVLSLFNMAPIAF